MEHTFKAKHLQQGANGEEQALNYLLQQGLVLHQRNYKCKLGEIDLIMRDNQHLVFVEVRFRQDQEYGGGIASITPSKCRKIIKSAMFYLQANTLTDKIPCRFDVIAIDGQNQITWIKDAFHAKSLH